MIDFTCRIPASKRPFGHRNRRRKPATSWGRVMVTFAGYTLLAVFIFAAAGVLGTIAKHLIFNY